MGSPFADEARQAIGEVVAIFGDDQGFLYEPMLQAAGDRPIADPQRPALQIKGALLARPLTVEPIAPHQPRDTALATSSQRFRFTMQGGSESVLGYRARAGDRLTRLSDRAVFQVQNILDDDIARLSCDVFRRSVAKA